MDMIAFKFRLNCRKRNPRWRLGFHPLPLSSLLFQQLLASCFLCSWKTQNVWLMNVIHYKEVDRTLSLNQFDSPTFSIDCCQAVVEGNKKCKKGDKQWKGEHSTFSFSDISVCAVFIENNVFRGIHNHFLVMSSTSLFTYRAPPGSLLNINARGRESVGSRWGFH